MPIPQGIRLSTSLADLDDAAVVEVTSEEKEYPVEAALVAGEYGDGVPPILALKPSG